MCVCACGGVAKGHRNYSAMFETHAGRVVAGCCARYAEAGVEVEGNGNGNRNGYERGEKDE